MLTDGADGTISVQFIELNGKYTNCLTDIPNNATMRHQKMNSVFYESRAIYQRIQHVNDIDSPIIQPFNGLPSGTGDIICVFFHILNQERDNIQSVLDLHKQSWDKNEKYTIFSLLPDAPNINALNVKIHA